MKAPVRSALILSLVSMPVLAQQDWVVRGTNTSRYSSYDTSGDLNAAAYRDTGDMVFNEFNVYLEKEDTDYSSWRSEISGVYNPNNDYRTREFGFTPERVNLTREDGTAAIPFRAQIGDYFSYASYMTLQRSLKGVQLELQPFSGNERQHSIQLSSGSSQSQWRDFDLGEDYFNALSYVINDADWGSWGLNLVHNSRDGNAATGSLDRDQRVISLAGRVPLTLNGQALVIESEVAAFDGDHDGLSGALSGQGQSDQGYRFELRGQDRAKPLEYRLRFEQYGQDFRPRGAIIIADRRLSEARAGWRFDSGIRLQGRAQHVEDGFETDNAFRTRMLGLNLSNVTLDGVYEGLTSRFDAYIQNNNNENNTVSYATTTLTANFNAPLTATINGRLDAFIQDLDSRIDSDQDTRTTQVALALDLPVAMAGWNGFLSSGLTVRRNETWVGDRDELSPTLSFQLGRRYHSLRFNYGGIVQNRRYSTASPDVTTQNLGLDYRYSRGQHLVGLEGSLVNRNPGPGQSTDSWLVSAYWTYRLDRPGRSRGAVIPAAGSAAGATSLGVNIAALAPGVNAGDVFSLLEAANVTGASTQSGWVVYETRVLPDVFQRQRLLLDYVGGVLRQSVVVIDFDDVGDTRSIQQIFEDVQQQLINEFGTPARTYSEGQFGPGLQQALASDRFMRINEWDTSMGVLRFGIPRRLDGQVRMEIQHTFSALPSGETGWSVDAIP